MTAAPEQKQQHPVITGGPGVQVASDASREWVHISLTEDPTKALQIGQLNSRIAALENQVNYLQAQLSDQHVSLNAFMARVKKELEDKVLGPEGLMGI